MEAGLSIFTDFWMEGKLRIVCINKFGKPACQGKPSEIPDRRFTAAALPGAAGNSEIFGNMRFPVLTQDRLAGFHPEMVLLPNPPTEVVTSLRQTAGLLVRRTPVRLRATPCFP